MNVRRLLSLSVAAVLGCAGLASADPKLPSIFCDNMVIQRDKAVPVWGCADAGEQITVKFAGQAKATKADAAGKWMVKLKSVAASDKPQDMTVVGKSTVTLKNVLIGEVWVCSGQSNMGFTAGQTHDASVEMPKATNPNIRLFTVERKPNFQPQSNCVGKWDLCTPETAKSFSAVGYYFGRDIQKALNVPVGLINTSWGGTPAQAWTSLPSLQADKTLATYVEGYKNVTADLAKLEEKYKTVTLPKWEADMKKWQETHGKAHSQAMAQWRKDCEAAKAAGKALPAQPPAPPRAPRKPYAPKDDPNIGSVLYNGMIQPLIPFAIRGAIWYQGESNAGQAVLYRTLFPTMIKDWRKAWGQGDFPFLWVQLANYMKRDADPTQSETGWPGLREAQSMTLKLKNTGQAVIIDIGEGDDIHPLNKSDVSKRLALAGRKVAYGQKLVYSGPTYDGVKVKDGKAILSFENIGGGLVIGAAPVIRLDQQPNKALDRLVGFSIAGADKKFVWANAKIEGDKVVVWSDAVKKPVAVRYAWANNPECNLYNKEGLPASPFRTDTWVLSPGEQAVKQAVQQKPAEQKPAEKKAEKKVEKKTEKK